MTAKDVVRAWLVGNGHSEAQAEVFFDSPKYQYLVTLIDNALQEGMKELTTEEQIEEALSCLYTVPEVRSLVKIIDGKIHAE